MDNAVIYGADERALRLYDKIKSKYNVRYFIDNNDAKASIWDIEVVMPNDGVDKIEKDDTIFFCIDNNAVAHATSLFRQYSGLRAYYVNPNMNDELLEIDISKPRLSRFEYSVAYKCNLNCKGCCHYSNIYEGEEYADYDNVICDFKRINELFWGVGRVRLMGGGTFAK